MNQLLNAATITLYTIAAYFAISILNALVEGYFAYKEHQNP